MAGSRFVLPEGLGESFRLQLQAATRSIKWTYSAFWQPSRNKEKVLVWGDGYYNGSIKTRKTIHARELTAEEFGLQRSQQLRDLYNTLLLKTEQQQASKPSALKPEDLAETEWFFLVCMSCSFADGVGLVGRAAASGSYIWLCGTNDTTTKVFTRSLLAKTACIQTVVCIPLWDGVLEFGTTDHVQEDPKFVQHVLSFLEKLDPVISENIKSIHQKRTPEHSRQQQESTACHSQQSSRCAGLSGFPENQRNQELPERTFARDVNFEVGSRSPKRAKFSSSRRAEAVDSITLCGESVDRVPSAQGTGVHNYRPVQVDVEKEYEEGKSNADSEGAPSTSAFGVWDNEPTPSQKRQQPMNQQWMLKEALFRVTHLYGAQKEDSKEAESSFATIDTAYEDRRLEGGSRKPGGGSEETNGSHVFAERRRREKLNDRFMTLRGLVPCISKMDKASILGDAIEYVKDLQRRVNDLESHNKLLQEVSVKQARNIDDNVEHTDIHTKCAIAEEVRCGALKETDTLSVDNGENVSNGQVNVKVSMENDVVILKLHCPWRETLLLDVLQTLNELQYEVFVVQAFTLRGSLTTSLKAKVRSTLAGTRPTITEVEEALQKIAKGR